MNKLLLTFALAISVSLQAQKPSGLLFDGIDDKVVLNGTDNLDLGTGEFTFEVTCKLNYNQLYFPILISNREIVDQGFLLGFYGDYDGSGRLFVQIDGMNLPINAGGANLMDNTCHHVAFTRGADSLHYYIDGIQVYSRGADLGTINTNHAFWIGNDEPTNTTPFNGVIKEVRFWNVERSELEIITNYTTQLSGTEPGLKGYWTFSEGAGQLVDDLSTNADDGVLGLTTSTEAGDPTWTIDCSIAGNTTGIVSLSKDEKKVVGYYDLLGRKTVFVANTPMIILYSDGSTEKVYLSE